MVTVSDSTRLAAEFRARVVQMSHAAQTAHLASSSRASISSPSSIIRC